MQPSELSVVTGAFGYTGKYITRRLLSLGEQVKTVTGHPDRPNPFGDQVSVAPFNFDNPSELAQSLRGATTLYNTYWVRFPRGEVTFELAVENTRTLVRAAEEAGVRRIVHISIANASVESTLPYFRGKGLVEQAILGSGLSYAIVRPTVMFGHEDVLINNIAWLLRFFPVFAVPGSGRYGIQPVFVEDVADLAIDAGQRDENVIMDAAGPETYAFGEMVSLVRRAIHSRARIVHVPPSLALFMSRVVGRMIGDVVLTRDEVEGLMANLLVSPGPPMGQTRLSDWVEKNADRVGTRYASELNRHYR